MTLQHALFRFAGAVVVATPLGIAGVPSGLGIHVTFLSESVALAQSSSVVADETLAVEERSQLVPNQLIRGIPSDRIDGGALRGINLFHSFLEFNVAEGRGLYFSNPIGVENILTRVTGSSPSTLLGRLGVLGNANLFLLNPNGILFGANASLDITGSFLASTASAIPLGETGRFSATAPQTSTLLSVQPDTRFLTALARQGEISNAGTLNVGVGQRLMLVGGTVINRGTLSAPEGMVQVVGDRIWNAPTGVIRADGLETGNGGTVLLLSEEVARVDGSISVRGGSGGGNGGFVETSSRGALTIQMTPDIAAPNGQGGTWLIDPNNITIVPDGIGTTNVTSSNPFASTGDGATLEVGLIQTALRSGNVTIATTTAAPNTEPGTITLVTPLDYDGIGTDRTLTLDAHSSIFLVAPIQDSDPVTGDRLNLALNADIAGTGAGQVFSSNPISTQGGSIVARGSSIFFVRSVDSGGGAIDLTALNPTQGITLLDRLNAGSGNLTLTADNLFLVGSVEGSGDLLVQPLTPERDLQLGGATFSGEYLSTDALNTFQNGFRSITIGRADGRGTLSLGGTVFFRDPVTLRSPAGAIDTRPFDILGFDNAAITLLAAQNIQTSDIFNFYAGVGNPITLVSTRGSISTGSLIAGSQNGRAGNILLSAAGDITTGNLTAQGSSDSGTITLNSDRGSVTITGSVRSEMFSSGGSANGGTIRISAFGDITTTGNIFSFTSSNFGTGGDILLTSTAGNIRTSGGEVRSGNFGRRSGNIILTAFGNVTTGDISASSVALRNSESGNISITSTNGSIDTTAGAIETNSRGGNAGNIAFAAGGNIATGTLQSLGFSALDFGNGGNIELIADGSIVAGDLYTLSTLGRAGSVRLIAPGTIQLQSLFTSGQQSSGDVEIRSGQPFVLNNTLIFSDTFGAGDGGRIAIMAPAIAITSGAQVSASTHGSGTGGTIRLQAVDRVELSGSTSTPPASDNLSFFSRIATLIGITPAEYIQGFAAIVDRDSQGVTSTLYPSGLFTQSAAEASGNAGSVVVETGQLVVRDQATIAASTFGSGTGGNIRLQTSGTTTIANGSILSGVAAGATGNSGDITLQARSLAVTDGGLIQTRTFGQGNAGSIQVMTADDIQIAGSNSTSGGVSSLRSGTEGLDSGRGGNLTLTTNRLTVTDAAILSAETSSAQRGGDITVNARTVNVSAGGQLLTNTTSRGNAGNITIANAQQVRLTGAGTGLFASSRGEQEETTIPGGSGGNIAIATDSLVLSDQAQLVATTTGSGSAGNIALRAQQVRVQTSAVVSTSTSGTGNAGNVDVQASNLTLQSGARITSLSTEQGNAGVIQVKVGDRLLSNAGEISASANQAGGGQIFITATDLRLTNSSLISSSVFDGGGGGGNIAINSSIFVALQDSDILANAKFGEGGRIVINSPVFLADLFTSVGSNPGEDFSRFRGNGRVDISASSQFGVSGEVSVPDFTFLQSALSSLAANFVNPEQVVAGSCLARRVAAAGSFTVTGTGGLARTPLDSTLPIRFTSREVRSLPGASAALPNPQLPTPNPTTFWKPGDPIQEASGMITTAEGRIMLASSNQVAAVLTAVDVLCGRENLH